MDKPKQFAVPSSKVVKTKRQSTINSVASASSRAKIPVSLTKVKVASRPKLDSTATQLDVSVMRNDVANIAGDLEGENHEIAYGKFLRAMLEECMFNEKIEREETEMDIQMAQLAERFHNTINQLDKTNRRLKDISFVAEQKRLLNLKNSDSSQFYTTTENSNTQETLKNLYNTEQTYLDRLETKNIDFGYDKNSGHQQLLDAVNAAIDGLEDIKKHSKLDIDKFREYEKSQRNLEDMEKMKLELNSLDASFDEKFPHFNENLLKEASAKIARMFDEEEEDD
ncbi:hypothetical protein K1T71_000675 [Dendrolimus kikuchii]|uniref:Uncharacterized protein n=1 Tax=Dendrolimus kikuchii TaxID=765133 RepID=A0ACC1DKY7_9NEOP|nr:hypothetical protein K1T71_000675 [Dendrolimus kikuchii]